MVNWKIFSFWPIDIANWKLQLLAHLIYMYMYVLGTSTSGRTQDRRRMQPVALLFSSTPFHYSAPSTVPFPCFCRLFCHSILPFFSPWCPYRWNPAMVSRDPLAVCFSAGWRRDPGRPFNGFSCILFTQSSLFWHFFSVEIAANFSWCTRNVPWELSQCCVHFWGLRSN